MKQLACILMAVLMTALSLAGCSASDGNDNTGHTPTGKVVVNFEGTVAEVNKDEVTLENGKIIVISSDTVFAGDPDTNDAVSKEIAAGNFIQGYTKDDPDGDRVSADKIYCNIAVQPGGGKLLVNFEGTIAAAEGRRLTLDSGQVILVTDDTVFSVATGTVENVILSEGHYIQGYTPDDPAASEITAGHIHIVIY